MSFSAEVEPVSDLGGGADETGQGSAVQQSSELFAVCLSEVEQLVDDRIRAIRICCERLSQQP
jgi:hypothetical protein